MSKNAVLLIFLSTSTFHQGGAMLQYRLCRFLLSAIIVAVCFAFIGPRIDFGTSGQKQKPRIVTYCDLKQGVEIMERTRGLIYFWEERALKNPQDYEARRRIAECIKLHNSVANAYNEVINLPQVQERIKGYPSLPIYCGNFTPASDWL